MATKSPTTPRRADLIGDETVFQALKNMAGYTPNNTSLTVTALQTLLDARETAREDEQEAIDALKAKKIAAKAANRAFHQAIKQAKKAVVVQFGDDSTEVAVIGLKRAEDYKRPVRKIKAAA